ncbi:alpha/beta fold hydrolase [Nocardioides sp.]|uniref:alpha/beta fold hydrolase n=1 Tax=Nocardioides sp. TaxID=35761 RepID=UPI0039E62CD4
MTDNADSNPEIGRMIDAGGILTNVHDIDTAAAGADTVVLLHGSGPGVSAWANWRATIPALARTMRVVAPDILGFGYTERPAGISYSPETWLRHLVDLLDALEIPTASVVGNSFGGGLALRLATEHPDRVDRLVLMGSAGHRFVATEGLARVYGYKPSVENMRAMMDLFAYDRSRVTDELAELRYEASVRPGVQEAFEEMFPTPYQAVVDKLAIAEDRLARLPHETLLLHGSDDRVIPVDSSLRLFELIPNAELHLFSKCGHWTQIEHAASFNALVTGFLSRGADRAR